MWSGFWATIGTAFFALALVFLALSGYHLAQRPDPVLYYLGYAMEFGACFVMCLLMYSMCEFFEKRKEARDAFNRAMAQTRGEKK